MLKSSLKNLFKSYKNGLDASKKLQENFLPFIDRTLCECTEAYPFKIKIEEFRKYGQNRLRDYVLKLEPEKIELSKNLERNIQEAIVDEITGKFRLLNKYIDTFGLSKYIQYSQEISLKELEEEVNSTAKNCLTKKEYFIFSNHFLYGSMTLKEIGKLYAIAPEKVGEIKKKALEKIKKAFREKFLAVEKNKIENSKENLLLERELIRYLEPYVKDFFKSKGKKPFYYSTKISDLEISTRSHNCLREAGINTLEELAQKTEAEMLIYPNFGRKSLVELKDLLKSHNLDFGMSAEEVFLRRNNYLNSEITKNIKINQALDKKLNQLNITKPLKECLEKNQLHTMADLAELTENKLKELCPEHFEEAKKIVKSFGLSLGMKIKKIYITRD